MTMFIGQTITVRGERYRVVDISAASTQPKFWGRRLFTLQNVQTGDLFEAYGKTVAGNSKLTPKTRT
jgi:hypothetical protein